MLNSRNSRDAPRSGRLRIIASIEESQVIVKILAYLARSAPEQHQAELQRHGRHKARRR